jgi:His-Xaa-Ser system protein HxsD
VLTEGLCGSRVVRFSSDLFDADTIKKAAYRLTNRCAFVFSTEAGAIVCEAQFSPPVEPDVADAFELQLRNEVLEQDLRRRISEETAAVRNAILAYAFSDTGLQGGE